MSDWLTSRQPAIAEPSNSTPCSSSAVATLAAGSPMCCHWPRRSVKRTSIVWTLSRSIRSSTAWTSAMVAPSRLPAPLYASLRPAKLAPRRPDRRAGHRRAVAGRAVACDRLAESEPHLDAVVAADLEPGVELGGQGVHHLETDRAPVAHAAPRPPCRRRRRRSAARAGRRTCQASSQIVPVRPPGKRVLERIGHRLGHQQGERRGAGDRERP